MAAASSEGRVEAAPCFGDGDEAAACSGDGVKAATCSGDRDKAAACSEDRIVDGRWRQLHSDF
jgi:hypothetical protein